MSPISSAVHRLSKPLPNLRLFSLNSSEKTRLYTCESAPIRVRTVLGVSASHQQHVSADAPTTYPASASMRVTDAPTMIAPEGGSEKEVKDSLMQSSNDREFIWNLTIQKNILNKG